MLSKDTIALVKTAKDYDIEIPIIESVVDYNLQRKKSLGNKIFKLIMAKLKIKISILGLSFKPGTDDIRESPSIDVINSLLNYGAKIFAFDPVAMTEAKSFK